jgi:hypothetical protein
VLDLHLDAVGDGAIGIADDEADATSSTSSRSNCLAFDLAREAVEARALLRAMKSSSCRRLASTAALVRSTWATFSRW